MKISDLKHFVKKLSNDVNDDNNLMSVLMNETEVAFRLEDGSFIKYSIDKVTNTKLEDYQ